MFELIAWSLDGEPKAKEDLLAAILGRLNEFPARAEGAKLIDRCDAILEFRRPRLAVRKMGGLGSAILKIVGEFCVDASVRNTPELLAFLDTVDRRPLPPLPLLKAFDVVCGVAPQMSRLLGEALKNECWRRDDSLEMRSSAWLGRQLERLAAPLVRGLSEMGYSRAYELFRLAAVNLCLR